MRVALAVLIVCLLVIGDVSLQCAERVREAAKAGLSDQLEIAIEDWEVPTYLAVIISLFTAACVVAHAFLGKRWIGYFTRQVAGNACLFALVIGLGAMLVYTVVVLVGGTVPGKLWPMRYQLESFWLIGAAVGGFAGACIGAGLGAASGGKQWRAVGSGPGAEEQPG